MRRSVLVFASVFGTAAACGGVTSVSPGSSAGGTSNVPDGSVSSGGVGGAGARPSMGGSGASTGGAGATGGVGASTGGVPLVLVDCKNPLSEGVACTEPSALCGGPCENSWQVENVCENGAWHFSTVVPCGPNASLAPQCHNSFSGGALTPCCAAGGLYCVGKADGYPGYGCTPGDGSFCACTCFQGKSQCGC